MVAEHPQAIPSRPVRLERHHGDPIEPTEFVIAGRVSSRVFEDFRRPITIDQIPNRKVPTASHTMN